MTFTCWALQMMMTNSEVGTATRLLPNDQENVVWFLAARLALGLHSEYEGHFLWRYSSQGVKVTTQLHLGLRLWSAAILPLPFMPTWCIQGQLYFVFSFIVDNDTPTPGHNILRCDIHVLSTARDSYMAEALNSGEPHKKRKLHSSMDQN
jgi:hypothetical protein